MKNKKIIFSDNSLFGLLNFRIDVILDLMEKGYKIFIIAPDENDLGLLEVPLGVKYYPIKIKRSSLNFFNEIKIILYYFYYYIKINPSVIFHYTIKPNTYGTIVSSLLGIKNFAVVAGLGYVFQSKKYKFKLIQFLFKFSLKFSTKIIVLNSGIYNFFIKNGFPEKKIVLFEYGEGVNVNVYK
jgi:hypothetical protein